MKKTIGIILLVIGGLNLVGLFVKLSQGRSLGSPMYLVLLVLLIGGGLSLINSKKKTSTDIEKKDNA